MSYFWIYRPTLGNCVSSACRSSPRLCPGSGSLLHAGAAFLAGTSRWALRRHDVRQQSRSFARSHLALKRSPNSNPALIRLSAMISQYFTAAPYRTRRASQPLPDFPKRANAAQSRQFEDPCTGISTKACRAPLRTPKPVISPRLLTSLACCNSQPESDGITVFRSIP